MLRIVCDLRRVLHVGNRRYEPNPELVSFKATDNVFPADRYARIAYSIEEIADMCREICHPTVHNQPNALLTTKIDLDIRTKKKSRMLESFEGFVDYTHVVPFKHQRRIVAVAKKTADQELAVERGAVLAGHSDIVRMIEKGTLKAKDDFDVLLCHTDSLLDIAPVRGLLKKHFPTKQKGNFGPDLNVLFERFERGFDFSLVRDDYDKTYGWVEVPFARVNMSNTQIRENLIQLLKAVELNRKSDSPGNFFHQVVVTVDPSPEVFRVKHWELLDGYTDPYLDLFGLSDTASEAAQVEDDEQPDDDEDKKEISKL